MRTGTYSLKRKNEVGGNRNMNRVSESIKNHIRKKWGLRSFCQQFKGKHARILDVGCGNGSPQRVKTVAPDSYYVGIDVADYNNTSATLNYADEYLLFSPESFAEGIANLDEKFDAVLSSHNIEHCNKPKETISAMCGRLKKGGRLYLAFPCEASVGFPSRRGTLNFFDDPTHRWLPKFDEIMGWLQSNRMEIVFACKQYRPPLFCILGGVMEPFSRWKNVVIHGTWAYWGFETVIWAEKKSNA